MQLTHSTMIKHTSPHLHLPLHMDRLGGSPSGAKKRVFEFLNKLRIKNHTIPHSQPSQPGLVVTVIIIIVVFLFSIINHRWHESYSHNLNIQIFNPNFSTLVIILTRKTNQLPIHQPPYLKPPLLDPDHPLSPPLSTPRLNHSLEIYGNLYKKSEISYNFSGNPYGKDLFNFKSALTGENPWVWQWIKNFAFSLIWVCTLIFFIRILSKHMALKVF